MGVLHIICWYKYLWAVQMSYFIHWESIRKVISLYDLQFTGIYKYYTYLYVIYKTADKFYKFCKRIQVFMKA